MIKPKFSDFEKELNEIIESAIPKEKLDVAIGHNDKERFVDIQFWECSIDEKTKNDIIYLCSKNRFTAKFDDTEICHGDEYPIRFGYHIELL